MTAKPRQARFKAFDEDFCRRALALSTSQPPVNPVKRKGPALARANDCRPSTSGVEPWLLNEAAYIRQFGY